MGNRKLIHAIRIAILLTVGVIVIGCGPANKLIGTWETQLATGTLVQTMNPDNTFEGTLSLPTPIGNLQFKMEGTYKYEDDMLETTATKFEAAGGNKSMAGGLFGKIEEEMKKPQKTQISWKGEDEFVATIMNQSVNFKRKKS